ncbi:MAG: linoleoyl-CoA desaturase [Bacteroidetes bacterium]|nr:MAG: linoleoyl-CoA desaturase [Bacteroidota bacterium]
MRGVSFGNNNAAFSTALKKKVDEYFSANGVKFTGNKKLYWKTAILMCSAAALYAWLVFLTPAWWLSIPGCLLLGFNMAAIGFNVMHDGAHGSFSQRKWVNEMMAYSLNLLGGCSYLWKAKHNVNHHNFTNIEGHDDDIDIKPWIRTNTNQPRRWYHRYQHIYWVVLYGFTYLIWVFSKDFDKYFRGKIGETKIKKMNVKEHIVFWASKLVYGFVFIALPIWQVGFLDTLFGYLLAAGMCGFVLAVVFQLAHVVEEASFPVPDDKTNKVKEDWTVHQLATTANFSTRSKFISWFVGGLNFQVEHHLFPRISHVHYPAISKVVKDVCSQFNVRYIEYPTFFSALKSHVLYLKTIGAQ